VSRFRRLGPQQRLVLDHITAWGTPGQLVGGTVEGQAAKFFGCSFAWQKFQNPHTSTTEARGTRAVS